MPESNPFPEIASTFTALQQASQRLADATAMYESLKATADIEIKEAEKIFNGKKSTWERDTEKLVNAEWEVLERFRRKHHDNVTLAEEARQEIWKEVEGMRVKLRGLGVEIQFDSVRTRV